MTDSLTVFGTNFTGVTGIKATGTGNGTLTYIRPQGTKSISANGTGIDVTNYAAVDVSVSGGGGNDFVVTLSYNSTSEMWEPDCSFSDIQNAYSDGKNVVLTAGEQMSVYVGYNFSVSGGILDGVYYFVVEEDYSHGGDYYWNAYALYENELLPDGDCPLICMPDIRTSSDVTVSGDTVTIPDGWYKSQLTKTVASGTAGTPTATKGTVSNHSVSVTPSVTNTTGYITGSTKTGTAVTVSASELVSGTYTVDSSGTKDVTNYASASVPAGTATAPSSISGSSATVSTGTNTLTLSKTVSVTPNVSTAGYVSSGTAGNSSVSLTASVTTKGATTYTPTTTNQTIASGTYLTGTQTISGDSNLVASNILSGKTIFGVSGSVTFATYYVSSSNPSGGNNGDIWLKTVS